MLRNINLYNMTYGHVSQEQEERLQTLIANLSPKEYKKLQEKLAKNMCNEIETITMIIYLVPKPTPRPRVGRSGIFYVEGSRDNFDLFQRFIEESKQDIYISTPTEMIVDSYLPIPKTMSPSDTVLAEMRRIRPISVPDWDNLGKTYSDMIRGALIDDSVIVNGTSNKYYSIRPRIEITLSFLKAHDSNYNFKKVKKWKTFRPNHSVMSIEDL